LPDLFDFLKSVLLRDRFIITESTFLFILGFLSRGESNPISLKLDKFAPFQLVVLERRQPVFVLRIEIALNFSAFKVEEFKNKKFR